MSTASVLHIAYWALQLPVRIIIALLTSKGTLMIITARLCTIHHRLFTTGHTLHATGTKSIAYNIYVYK